MRQTDKSNTQQANVSIHNKLLKESTKALKPYLQKALAVHLEQIEQQLYDVSDAKASDAVSLDIKVLQKSSSYLSSLFIDSVIKNILSFAAQSTVNTDNTFYSSAKEKDWSGLQLLETDEVENQLLVDNYVSTNQSRLNELLYALQRRIECIGNKAELSSNKNPFGPSVLMNTYIELIKGESFSKEASKLLCQSFNQTVLLNIDDTLEEINALFIEAGILPKLPGPKARPGPTKKIVKNSLPQQEKKQIPSVSDDHPCSEKQGTLIEPELYGSLKDMAKVYRIHGGEKVASDGLTVSGEQLATTELINTLSDIQQHVGDGESTLQNIRLQIGEKIQVNGQRRPYAEQDDTLIDVVAMFFDVMLQDRHLPDTVRAMIAQLQIPILKVSMLDKDFFAKKSHPARRFLNALSQAGLGVSEKTKQIKSAIFEKMEELVNRVLMEFSDDVEVFAELVEEFEIFMDQQQRQIDLIEERSRKVTKSSEQLELTKRQAAYEIALRLTGQSIPEFIYTFLEDAWKDVLILALLRREKDPTESTDCLDVLERLIASAVPSQNIKERQTIREGLPSLLKGLKVGLDNISYDFHQSLTFLKALELWHQKILAADSEGLDDDIPVAEEVVLMDFEEVACDASADIDNALELEAELASMPNDKFSQYANTMQMGDWVNYTTVEGLVLRAKLSWKSEVTSRCLFVDNRGIKAMDIRVAELAEGLRQKTISLVGQEKTPLVERVLTGMKNMMQSQQSKPSMA
ncbi:MAG: DUF1631 domain-containing protein [Cycloclasticus sp.]|nr:DUF1631 domain-containing protein [Cycloclasticus sp.]MBQ0790735.1 DUF1631 domain-containing protein [Cycloclasticus sp.]